MRTSPLQEKEEFSRVFRWQVSYLGLHFLSYSHTFSLNNFVESKIVRSHKFRIYPTRIQKVLLEKHFGCRRFVWNYFLDLKKEEYLKNKKTVNYYECASLLVDLKKNHEWLGEVNAQSLQQTLRDMEIAYNRFFKKTSDFPNFKSKSKKQSFRVPQRFRVENNRLFVPKFAEGIRIKIHNDYGEIRNIMISRTPTGKYYASFVCDEPAFEKLPKNNRQIGIDLGLKEFAVCSDGQRFENPKFYYKQEKKLKYNQRQHSKKRKQSKSREKQRRRLATVYERVTNSKNDFLHKLSHKLVHENQVICIEDLNIKGMLKNHKLAKAISSCGWGEFVRQLEYKCSWYGRELVKIERFFPSSKTCHECGWINENLELKDRSWQCCCGKILDRDLNAAKNILLQGMNILSGCGSQSDVKQKRVEALSIGKSMKPGIVARQ